MSGSLPGVLGCDTVGVMLRARRTSVDFTGRVLCAAVKCSGSTIMDLSDTSKPGLDRWRKAVYWHAIRAGVPARSLASLLKVSVARIEFCVREVDSMISRPCASDIHWQARAAVDALELALYPRPRRPL